MPAPSKTDLAILTYLRRIWIEQRTTNAILVRMAKILKKISRDVEDEPRRPTAFHLSVRTTPEL